MLTNVEGCEADALTVGMQLVVDFREESDEITIPVFRPVSPGSAPSPPPPPSV
jgi:hypothetical protein